MPARAHRHLDGTTTVTTCDVSEYELWSIYGRNADGMAEILHDASTRIEACAVLVWLMRTHGRPGGVGLDPTGWFEGDTPAEINGKLTASKAATAMAFNHALIDAVLHAEGHLPAPAPPVLHRGL